MQPGKRTPAPGPLALVQAFANSKDLLTAQDIFTSPEMVQGWLVARGLLAKEEFLSEEDYQRVLTFREALRALIQTNTGAAFSSEALESLNSIAGSAHMTVCFSVEGQPHLQSDTPGIDGALGRLLAIIYTSVIDGSWKRLKACQNEECQWVYYDSSKNRSSNWCTMSMCGNRLKTRTYRQRRKEQQDVSGQPRRSHPSKQPFHRQQSNR